MQVKITSNQDQILASLSKAPAITEQFLSTTMGEIGLIVEDTARDYSPISPTKSQYVQTLKKGKSKQSFLPGTLMRSITHKLKGKTAVEIFTNQSSKDYARFIHDGKYELGVGSKSKKSTGKKVGPRFIERAIEDNAKTIKKKLERLIDRLNDRL